MNFMGMGPLEILLILILGFLFFGPEKLPTMAAKAGRLYRNFKKASFDLTKTITEDLSTGENTVSKDLSDIGKTLSKDLSDIGKTVTKGVLSEDNAGKGSKATPVPPSSTTTNVEGTTQKTPVPEPGEELNRENAQETAADQNPMKS